MLFIRLYMLLIILSLFSSAIALKTPSPMLKPTTTIAKDYTLAGGLLAISAASALLLQPGVCIPTGALGAFLAIQTGKIKFTFDNDAMEIFVIRKGLDESRENFVVGGKNRWKYSTFTKWGFLPSKEFPILMYFLETQTKPEGQFHLFPVIINSKELFDALSDNVGQDKYK